MRFCRIYRGHFPYTIEEYKKTYYDKLEIANKHNEITEWLCYFGQTVIDAQAYTLKQIEFLITKTKFYDHFKGRFNPRQSKVIELMFCEGLGYGFKGGLSAENYLKITKTTRATATGDLQDLVEKNAPTRIGERRYTRYYLKLNFPVL